QKEVAISQVQADRINEFISQVRNRLSQLADEERHELAHRVASQIGKGYTAQGVLNVPDYETAKECSDEMEKRDAQERQRALQEFQKRQEEALEQQKKQIAENKRLLQSGEHDLEELRTRLADAKPGNADRPVLIAAIVDLCERMAKATHESADGKGAA